MNQEQFATFAEPREVCLFCCTHVFYISDFCAQFELGLLDLAPNHEDLRFVPAKLWAVVSLRSSGCNLHLLIMSLQIYDACFEQGRLFVVTNYLGWVFGEFSLGTFQLHRNVFHC